MNIFSFLNLTKKIRVSYIPGSSDDVLSFNTFAISIPHGQYYEHSDSNTRATATMIYPNGTSIEFTASTWRGTYPQFDECLIDIMQETGWLLLGSRQVSETKNIHEFALKNNPSTGSILLATVAIKDLYENAKDPSFLSVQIDTDGAVVKDQAALKIDANTLADNILASLPT